MPLQTYTTLDDPSATAGTFAQAISSSGQIVGHYQDNQGSGLHGFLLSGGTYTTLDDTVAFFGTTLASGINGSGQIVGYYDNSTGRHGFLYNPNGATYTPLDDPSGSSGTTQALGINDLGQIVGSYGDSNHHPHGFLLSGTTYTESLKL
jgi:probable HAF family extracellular repeat protein